VLEVSGIGGGRGYVLDPSCNPKDGDIHINCLIEKRDI
jgi:hypothetical protein